MKTNVLQQISFAENSFLTCEQPFISFHYIWGMNIWGLKSERMIGLIFKCPVGEEMEDCPLKTLRKLPFIERIKAYEQLSTLEKDKIQLHHEVCLARREGKLLDN